MCVCVLFIFTMRIAVVFSSFMVCGGVLINHVLKVWVLKPLHFKFNFIRNWFNGFSFVLSRGPSEWCMKS
jgi:hypothetical protein